MKAIDEAGGPTRENLSSVPVPPAPESLGKATEGLLATSLLLGIDHASGALILADDSFSLPFEEAAAFLKGRVPLTKKEWNALEPKLRFRAFTVAALTTPDAVERVRTLAIGAVEKGTPLSEFWTAANAEGAAGIGASPWYWETVYRTNLQTSYNAGRAIELTRNQPEYLEFLGIGDIRQTEICRSRSGTILPASHPFWKTNWPPLHFSCRSTVRSVSQEEVDALRQVDPDWKPASDEALPEISAAKGFGGNPIETDSFWKMTAAMAKRAEELGMMPDIERLAKQAGIGIQDVQIVPKFRATRVPRKNQKTPQAAATDRGPPSSTPTEKVPTFTTVREAELWVVQTDLADACSFKGCDIKVVQEWAENLHKDLTQFPAARKNLQFFGTIQERNVRIRDTLAQKRASFYQGLGYNPTIANELALEEAGRWLRKNGYIARAGNIAQYAPLEGFKGICVNASYGKDHASFARLLEQNVASGHFPKGAGRVGAVAQHELGHLLDAVSGLHSTPELLSYWNGLSKAEIKTGLSFYASTSLPEFVAEAWSEYSISPTPRPMAVKVAELLIARLRSMP